MNSYNSGWLLLLGVTLTSCLAGFFVQTAVGVQRSTIDNCDVCNITTSCTQCSPTYGLTNNKTCKSCGINSGCAFCTNMTVCDVCNKSSLVPDTNGTATCSRNKDDANTPTASSTSKDLPTCLEQVAIRLPPNGCQCIACGASFSWVHGLRKHLEYRHDLALTSTVGFAWARPTELSIEPEVDPTIVPTDTSTSTAAPSDATQQMTVKVDSDSEKSETSDTTQHPDLSGQHQLSIDEFCATVYRPTTCWNPKRCGYS